MRHPESDLVRKTFVLRKMDLPPQVLLTKKSLLRWIALSLGLISENESRSSLINILDAFFFFLFSKKSSPSSKEIKSFLEKNRGISVSEKLVRYHLNRLCGLGIVSHSLGRYSLNPAPEAERDSLSDSFAHWFGGDLSGTVSSVERALGKLQGAYEK